MAEPAEAIDAFLTDDAVVWVGAGLSAEHGYPGWSELIRGLCGTCGIPFPDERPTATVLMELADSCRHADADAYGAYLVDQLGEDTLGVVSREIHRDLLRLRQPAYITTNLDHLLTQAATRVDHEVERMQYPDLLLRPMFRGKSVIYHLHGRAEVIEEGFAPVVLSKSEFEEAYGEEGHAKRFIWQVLHEWPVMFVGVGKGLTEDRYLRRLIEASKRAHDEAATRGLTGHPRRLALITLKVGLPGPEQQEEEARFDSIVADLAVGASSVVQRV